MNEQEIRARYPGAHIRRGVRNDGWLIDRYPLTDELTVPQWAALESLADSGSFYPAGTQVRVLRTLAAYGLAQFLSDGCVIITPAGRDYSEGHFSHGWIPDESDSLSKSRSTTT